MDRYRDEIDGARVASRRLEILSRAAVVVGTLAIAALAALMATGSLDPEDGLGLVGALVFSVILAGLGGHVAAWGLLLNASRLEMSLAEEAGEPEYAPTDSAKAGAGG